MLFLPRRDISILDDSKFTAKLYDDNFHSIETEYLNYNALVAFEFHDTHEDVLDESLENRDDESTILDSVELATRFEQDIGDAPYDRNKVIVHFCRTPLSDRNIVRDMIADLNDRQRLYLQILCRNVRKGQVFHHFLTGGAGTGKTHLLKTLYILSRSPCELEAQINFVSAQRIQREIEQSTDTVPDGAFEENGIIMMPTDQGSRVFVPSALRHDIMSISHQTFGHLGIKAMKNIIGMRYAWPHMNKDIDHFIKGCTTCQKCKDYKSIRQGPMGHMEVNEPMHVFAMDTSSGFHNYGTTKCHLTVVIDHGSRFAWTFGSRNITQEHAISCLRSIFNSCGVPEILHTSLINWISTSLLVSLLIGRVSNKYVRDHANYPPVSIARQQAVDRIKAAHEASKVRHDLKAKQPNWDAGDLITIKRPCKAARYDKLEPLSYKSMIN